MIYLQLGYKTVNLLKHPRDNPGRSNYIRYTTTTNQVPEGLTILMSIRLRSAYKVYPEIMSVHCLEIPHKQKEILQSLIEFSPIGLHVMVIHVHYNTIYTMCTHCVKGGNQKRFIQWRKTACLVFMGNLASPGTKNSISIVLLYGP